MFSIFLTLRTACPLVYLNQLGGGLIKMISIKCKVCRKKGGSIKNCNSGKEAEFLIS